MNKKTVRPIGRESSATTIEGYVQDHLKFTIEMLDKAENPFEFMNIIGQHEGVMTSMLPFTGMSLKEVTSEVEKFRRDTFSKYNDMWETIHGVMDILKVFKAADQKFSG